MPEYANALFCSRSCKELLKRKKYKGLIKVVMLCAVSCIFLVNLSACVWEFCFHENSVVQLVLLIIYSYLFLETAANYFLTAYLRPGYSYECQKQIDRICTICNHVKPFRTRHCSVCNICVTKWDHHCFWVQNCIGYKNYGQFFNLMLWSSLCLIFSGITIMVNVILDFIHKIPISKQILPLVAIVVTLSFGFAVVQLFVFHVKNIVHNLTTSEYHELESFKELDPKYEHPYDKGAKQNFREVIPHAWRMFIPGVLIHPNFDPYYSYDYKYMRDLKCDFSFKEEQEIVIQSDLQTLVNSQNSETIRSQKVIFEEAK